MSTRTVSAAIANGLLQGIGTIDLDWTDGTGAARHAWFRGVSAAYRADEAVEKIRDRKGALIGRIRVSIGDQSVELDD